jgi:hypothetical protein
MGRGGTASFPSATANFHFMAGLWVGRAFALLLLD